MTDGTVLHLLTQMLMVSVKLGTPVLLTALVVGVGISILQAATQVQEMTVTYVPKIAAIALIIAILGPWMLHVLVNYSTNLLGHLGDFAH